MPEKKNLLFCLVVAILAQSRPPKFYKEFSPSLTAVELEEEADAEVVQETAVGDERDQRDEAALTRRRVGFGSVGLQLTQDWQDRTKLQSFSNPGPRVRIQADFYFCIADCWQLKYILHDTRGLTACNGHQQTSLGHLEPGVQVFQQLLSHIQPAVNPNTHRNNSAIISRQKRRHTFVTALTLCSCRFRLLAPKSRQRPPGCREWLCAFQWNWTQTNEWKDFESLNKREILNKTRSHRCPWIQFT